MYSFADVSKYSNQDSADTYLYTAKKLIRV